MNVPRQNNPKQLVDLIDKQSLMRLTFDRIKDLVSPANIFVSTVEEFQDEIQRQIPEILESNIIVGV